jgi:hypothetical protein
MNRMKKESAVDEKRKSEADYDRGYQDGFHDGAGYGEGSVKDAVGDAINKVVRNALQKGDFSIVEICEAVIEYAKERKAAAHEDIKRKAQWEIERENHLVPKATNGR